MEMTEEDIDEITKEAALVKKLKKKKVRGAPAYNHSQYYTARLRALLLYHVKSR